MTNNTTQQINQDDLETILGGKTTRRGFLKGLAAVAGAIALPTVMGCSHSTGPDITDIYKSYNVAYIEAQSKLSNESTLDRFANALMTGDITGYTKDQVKAEIRNWIDGNASNEEIFFGLGITDQGAVVNGEQKGVVAFKFGKNAETPDYTMEVSNISREAMNEIKSIFSPTGGIQHYVYGQAMNKQVGSMEDSIIVNADNTLSYIVSGKNLGRGISFDRYYHTKRR